MVFGQWRLALAVEVVLSPNSNPPDVLESSMGRLSYVYSRVSKLSLVNAMLGRRYEDHEARCT